MYRTQDNRSRDPEIAQLEAIVEPSNRRPCDLRAQFVYAYRDVEHSVLSQCTEPKPLDRAEEPLHERGVKVHGEYFVI